MVYGVQQEKEIKTIKKRTIQLNLSDADIERITNFCGKNKISVAELLEGFIGDLVDGTYTHGSDERDMAWDYVERCGYDMWGEETLLQNLLDRGIKPEDYLYAVEHNYNDYLDDIIEVWQPKGEVNLEKEVENIQRWVAEKKSLME